MQFKKLLILAIIVSALLFVVSGSPLPVEGSAEEEINPELEEQLGEYIRALDDMNRRLQEKLQSVDEQMDDIENLLDNLEKTDKL